MKNNKGMTLIEIIISIVLISIVLIFIFALLINVRNINEESTINTTYLMNKALVIKDIEEDLQKNSNTKISINSCDIKNTFYSEYQKEENDKDLCFSFIFDEEESNISYLAIYRHSKKNEYVISYIHGDDFSMSRLMKDYNSDTLESKLTPIKESDVIKGFLLYIKIIGPDSMDYSINIPYYNPDIMIDIDDELLEY